MTKINVTEQVLGCNGNAGEYYKNRTPIKIKNFNTTLKNRIIADQQTLIKIDRKIKMLYGSRINFCRKTLYNLEYISKVLDNNLLTVSQTYLKKLTTFLGIKHD